VVKGAVSFSLLKWGTGTSKEDVDSFRSNRMFLFLPHGGVGGELGGRLPGFRGVRQPGAGK